METKQTFVYKPKMSYSDFYGAAAFAVAALLCWYFQYGIRFKSLRLLAYPNSVYAFGGLALICLVWALLKFGKTAKSRNNSHPVTVGVTSFSFPHKNGKAEVSFSEIVSIDRLGDDDGDDSFRVAVQGKSYTFDEANFESKAKYTEFVELIEKRRQESL